MSKLFEHLEAIRIQEQELRESLIDALESLARSLSQEAQKLRNDPRRDPNYCIMSDSQVPLITQRAVELTCVRASIRSLTKMV